MSDKFPLHIWKVPLYGPSGVVRCQECGIEGEGYEIANELEQQLSRLREAAQAVVDSEGVVYPIPSSHSYKVASLAALLKEGDMLTHSTEVEFLRYTYRQRAEALDAFIDAYPPEPKPR